MNIGTNEPDKTAQMKIIHNNLRILSGFLSDFSPKRRYKKPPGDQVIM